MGIEALSQSHQLLVATSRYLLKVNVESEEISVVDRGHGLYYGITWDASWIYVAARWYPPLVPTAHIERPRLLVFDRDLKFVERQRFPFKAGGLHQILFHQQRLYCSCSRQDAILVRDLEKKWSVWHPSTEPAHHGRDTHHFNSIWFDDDRMFLAGHNNGPSDLWEFTADDRQLIAKHRVGHYIHNIWKEGNQLTVCNSFAGTVESVDGRVLCSLKGFPRGVMIGHDINVIGVSDIANRRQRSKMTGRLHIYSKEWELQKVINLGQCGQVNELRNLNGHDASHPTI